MMQRVVAVLTQAGELAKVWEEDPDRDVSDQTQMAGELISEALSPVKLTISNPTNPQAVVDAVVQALQPRIGQLVGCFIAAFTRLALHHDDGDTETSSTDVLRQLALEWEMNDESE